MDQILARSDAFTLVKRSKNGKKWYEVKCDAWASEYTWTQIRDFFDPQRTKSGRHGTRWKYRNRKDAEQMYTVALMRWS